MEIEIHDGEIAAAIGEPLPSAVAAVVMVHGRGDSAHGILELARAFLQPGVAFLAPQAAGNAWYPQSFLAPTAANEPWLTSALNALASVLADVAAAGLARDRTVLLGFSQGGCLASEYCARNAERYAGLIALSGGLIGPPGTARDYRGSLDGTPVFLGCSDVDPHIPLERVEETAEVLAGLGAIVEKRIYPNFGHAVNQDEVDWIAGLLAGLAS